MLSVDSSQAIGAGFTRKIFLKQILLIAILVIPVLSVTWLINPRSDQHFIFGSKQRLERFFRLFLNNKIYEGLDIIRSLLT